jgi:hypothetical protein
MVKGLASRLARRRQSRSADVRILQCLCSPLFVEYSVGSTPCSTDEDSPRKSWINKLCGLRVVITANSNIVGHAAHAATRKDVAAKLRSARGM